MKNLACVIRAITKFLTKNRFNSLFMLCILSELALAQTMQHHPSADTKPAVLMSGLGEHNHPVSTKNSEAQRFFNQGLTFIFAFNHDESVRSFKRAAELDPNLAMAYWGIALALGPNINLDVDPEREKAAYKAVQKALALSANAPEQERAYIESLAKRYSIDPKADLKKLAVDYKNAMGELVKRNPNHIGANHYYIHTIEASLHPERALPSAERLKTLAPAAGHLVHMPAHIYMRTGDYKSADQRNKVAAEVDQAYIKSSGVQGVYPLMYYSHNLHFLAVAYAMEGRFSGAKK